MTRPMARLGRFIRDRKGVSAVEFAFIAPVLILAYFGVAELCGAMLAERKASHAASAIGDLVSQAQTLHDSDVTDIFSVASAIMSPYSTTGMKMKITSIQENAAGTASTVLWSDGSGMTGDTAGSTVTIPANLIAANQSIIRAEVQYTYNSPVNYVIKNALNYDEVFYLRPRVVDPIVRTSP